MVQRNRGKGETIHNQAELLQAMGEARRVLIEASSQVRPFGPTYNQLHVVMAGIDAAAHYLTGNPVHYSIGGSVAPQRGPMG